MRNNAPHNRPGRENVPENDGKACQPQLKSRRFDDSMCPREASTLPNPFVGQVLASRFRIESVLAEDALGLILVAKELQGERPVSVRVPNAEWFRDPEGTKTLRAVLKIMARHNAPGLVTPLGSARGSGGQRWVLSEPMRGMTLAQALITGRDRGSLPLKHATRVIDKLSQGLAQLPANVAHGMVRSDFVWVDAQTKQARLSDLAVAHAALCHYGTTSLPDSALAGLAPEIVNGQRPTPASDVFGVASLLALMLTGEQDAVDASTHHPEVSAELGAVILQALAPNPADRFSDMTRFRQALARAGLGLDTAEEKAAAVSVQSALPRLEAAASLDSGLHASVSEVAGGLQPSRKFDISKIVERLRNDPNPCWLVVRDRLDHGPFSAAELAERVIAGEYLANHILVDTETSRRQSLGDHPDFGALAANRARKERQKKERAAEARAIKREKLMQRAKLVIVAVGLLGLVAALGVWLLNRPAPEAEHEAGPTSIEELYAAGKIVVESEVGLLPDEPVRPTGNAKTRRKPARRAVPASSDGRASYEDAMSQAVDLGDVSKGGGQARLTSAEVTKVMNAHLKKLLGCVGSELSSGGKLTTVQVDLAIAGSGKVLGASARQGSEAFKRCIETKTNLIPFPTFEAPRMGARFAFKVR